MLQIYVYGPKEEGWLDLNPGAQIELEENAEAFDEDLSTGTFTIPLDVPWTEHNRRLLNFAERPENFVRTQKIFRCDVYNDGLAEMVYSQLTILEKNGAFNFSQGSFNCSIAGTKGLFGTLIKNKKITDLTLGGAITWEDDDSRTFAYKVATGIISNYPQLRFAPVAIEEFFQKDRPDFDDEFIAQDTVNTIVVNETNTAWSFGRPLPTDPNTVVPQGVPEYCDYRTIPFFQVKFVLKKIFEENNFKVSGAIVDETYFDDLVIFNNYAIEYYLLSPTYNDLNRQINPKNHVPDISIADFLRGLFALFNVFPSFQNATDVKLVYRESILTNRQIFSINNLVAKVFNANYEEGNDQDGYTLDYQWDNADQYYSDRVKEFEKKTFVGTVQFFSDLQNLDIDRPLTTDDYAFVESENLYYQVANSTVTPILWDAIGEELGKYVEGNGDRTPEIGISTLCTYVEYDPDDALFEKRLYAGTRQPGTYRNNRGTWVKNKFGFRVFFIKMGYTGYINIPVSGSHLIALENWRFVTYSLAWKGRFGLVEKFHKKWQQSRNNAQILKAQMQTDQSVYENLRKANCLEIESILTIPVKIERSIPDNGSMKMHMMIL